MSSGRAYNSRKTSKRKAMLRIFKTDGEMGRWVLPLIVGLLIGSVATAAVTSLLSNVFNPTPVHPTAVRYHSARNLQIEHLTSSTKIEQSTMLEKKSADKVDVPAPSVIRLLKTRNFGSITDKSNNMTRYSPDTCMQFDWIDRAVDIWFRKITKAYKSKEQLPPLKSVLGQLRNSYWYSIGYRVGLVEVILQPTDNGNIKMKLLEINPPNADHKNTGTLYMLEKAIEHFGPELAKQLGPDVKNLRLFIQTEDFPTQTEWEGPNHQISPLWVLPLFSACTSREAYDIPIPDFSFGSYPEMKKDKPSWDAISSDLIAAGDSSPWSQRKETLFYRGAYHAGGHAPKSRIEGAALFESMSTYLDTLRSDPYANNKNLTTPLDDVLASNFSVDVADTGYGAAKKTVYVPLEGWCDYKYLLHLPGLTYAPSLKYRLACGSVVVWFEIEGFKRKKVEVLKFLEDMASKVMQGKELADMATEIQEFNTTLHEGLTADHVQFSEFFYPGLEDGVHYLAVDPQTVFQYMTERKEQIKAMKDNLEYKKIWSSHTKEDGLMEILKSVVLDDENAEQMGRNARDFIANNLREEAVYCYWYKILLAYLDLYKGLPT